MLRKLLYTGIAMLLLPAIILAQGTVTGTVTDSRTGETMPGVNIFLVELERGAAADADGEFQIQNVPSGTYTLRATFVGYRPSTTEIEVGTGEVVQNISLEQDITGLEEIVVTGVGSGTQTKKLGFSVSKISESELSKVPATNVGSALYGKTSGVTIVSASGDPASAPSIRLRGSTSINGDQEPLIILDGIITNGSLQDISMQDVKSIEIVKGAAAASLYGSLAGNGVIQIITKSASDGAEGTTVTFRTEYGISEIAKDYPVATTHPWVADAQLTEDGNYIESWPGYGTFNADRAWNNEFPVQYNNVDAIFTGKPFNTNYIRIGGTAEDFNYSAAYENLNQSGVVENLPNYVRNTFRFNADYNSQDFNLSFRGSYISAEYPYFTEQGQGANYFYSALTAPPYVSLLEKNTEGEYSNQPTGYSIAGSNWQNPLYVAKNMERNTNRDRFIAGLSLNYNVTDWLSVNARQSMDTRNQVNRMHTPVGYQTPTPSAFYNNGFESIENVSVSTQITEVWAAFDRTFADGNVNMSGTVKYLFENRDYNQDYSRGYNYSASGIREIGSTDPASLAVSSTVEEEKVVNYIANANIDYQDKIIVGAMLRRDGSSLFGEDERYKYYYRGSLAYRLTEDIDINNINELKLRVSYGTSGNRAPWEAQYETYAVSGTSLVPQSLGNTEIKPSVVAETEFGVDVTFLDRYSFTANYALANVTDDYLEVPLSGTSAFSSQWRNVGEIETTALEFELGGQVISQQDMTWNVDLAFSKITQKVTDMGGVPAFTRGAGNGFDAAIDLFRFEEGVPYGAMYGNKLISSVDQLTVNDNGVVVNIPGGYTPEDFTVNELGHVVLADAQGTDAERPMFLVNENGDKEVTNIGNTNPDFSLGLASDFNFKGIGIYMIWDLSVGGDVYNYTRQLMYNRYLHKDLETYTRDLGLDPQYAIASDGLYNGSEAISHFVEDGSYLKLREASISYTLSNDMLGSIGSYVRDIRLSVVGRNLLTFTEYTGFDPEVALRSNSSNFRIDEFAYPNFRTYSGAIQVRF